MPLCDEHLLNMTKEYRAFSLTWSASMLIYWNKRKRLHKKRVQLPQDFLGTPTWPPFHCFGTPIWPPWRHVKTLYTVLRFTEWGRENEKCQVYGYYRYWTVTRNKCAIKQKYNTYNVLLCSWPAIFQKDILFHKQQPKFRLALLTVQISLHQGNCFSILQLHDFVHFLVSTGNVKR